MFCYIILFILHCISDCTVLYFIFILYIHCYNVLKLELRVTFQYFIPFLPRDKPCISKVWIWIFMINWGIKRPFTGWENSLLKIYKWLKPGLFINIDDRFYIYCFSSLLENWLYRDTVCGSHRTATIQTYDPVE